VRTVQTFILRLLIDPAEPEALRGAVEPVPEGESRPFASDQALLALLRQMVLPAPVKPGSETTNDRNGKCVEGIET
jgi:hypothetical protein